jgi:hypothetical protein
MDPLDVLCVDDAATDVFIRLDDPPVLVREEAEGRWIACPTGQGPLSLLRDLKDAPGGYAVSTW